MKDFTRVVLYTSPDGSAKFREEKLDFPEGDLMPCYQGSNPRLVIRFDSVRLDFGVNFTAPQSLSTSSFFQVKWRSDCMTVHRGCSARVSTSTLQIHYPPGQYSIQYSRALEPSDRYQCPSHSILKIR